MVAAAAVARSQFQGHNSSLLSLWSRSVAWMVSSMHLADNSSLEVLVAAARLVLQHIGLETL